LTGKYAKRNAAIEEDKSLAKIAETANIAAEAEQAAFESYNTDPSPTAFGVWKQLFNRSERKDAELEQGFRERGL